MIDAALDALREEGYASATARSIAAHGGFNPALIFYHYGSVDDLFIAALERTSTERLERYHEALDDVSDLVELVRRLRSLYFQDAASAHIAAIHQLVAGSSDSPEMARRIGALLHPWFAFVEGLVDRVLGGSPLGSVFRGKEIALGLVSMYMGLETMTRLTEGEAVRLDTLFSRAEQLARLLGPLFQQPRSKTRKSGNRLRAVEVE